MSLHPDVVASSFVSYTEIGDQALLELISSDSIDHVSGQRGPGIWRTVLEWLDASFADRTVELHAVGTAGDRVMVWVTVHATHVGSAFPWLRGRPASGCRVAWQQVHIFRIAGDRVTEHWAVRDDLRVLEAIDDQAPAP